MSTKTIGIGIILLSLIGAAVIMLSDEARRTFEVGVGLPNGEGSSTEDSQQGHLNGKVVDVVGVVSHGVEKPMREEDEKDLQVISPDVRTSSRESQSSRLFNPSVSVPSSAVFTTREGTFVLQVKDHQVVWIDVRIGVKSQSLMEVFGDLHEGDFVVVWGTDELRPGTVIQPKVIKDPE